jgi:hypothetical protein
MYLFAAKRLDNGKSIIGSLVQLEQGAVIIAKPTAYLSDSELSFDKDAGADFALVDEMTIKFINAQTQQCS